MILLVKKIFFAVHNLNIFKNVDDYKKFENFINFKDFSEKTLKTLKFQNFANLTFKISGDLLKYARVF